MILYLNNTLIRVYAKTIERKSYYEKSKFIFMQFLSTDLIQRLLACTFVLQLEQKLTDSILIDGIV